MTFIAIILIILGNGDLYTSMCVYELGLSGLRSWDTSGTPYLPWLT